MLELLALGCCLLPRSVPETTGATVRRAPLPRLDSDMSDLSPDGRRLAIATPPDRVIVLGLPSGEIEAMCEVPRGSPLVVAWRGDGERVAVLDSQAGVTVFEAATGHALQRRQCAPELPGSSDYDLRALTYVAESTVLAVGFGSLVELLDDGTGASIVRIEPDAPCGLSAMAVSRDGNVVGIGDREGSVSVWDSRTGQRVHGPCRIPQGRDWPGVHALAFDPSGRALASGSGDCTARVWRFAERGRMQEFTSCDRDAFGGLAIGQVHFSPDGSRLLTTTFEWWVTSMWDTASRERLWTHDFGGGNPSRMDAGFTSDGRFVFTREDGLVLDVEDGTVLRSLEKDGEGRWPWYRASGGLAWSARNDRLRVCDVESGLVILERTTL